MIPEIVHKSLELIKMLNGEMTHFGLYYVLKLFEQGIYPESSQKYLMCVAKLR